MDMLQLIENISKEIAKQYKIPVVEKPLATEEDSQEEWEREQQADMDHDRMADFREYNNTRR